jgi:hypothetical protein
MFVKFFKLSFLKNCVNLSNSKILFCFFGIFSKGGPENPGGRLVLRAVFGLWGVGGNNQRAVRTLRFRIYGNMAK